jgi:hypothetical protein
MTKKINCWEYKKCGREPGVVNVDQLGERTAATDVRADSIHGGINGGRVCWVVTGTFCDGNVQGSFASKLSSCLECEFYKHVANEEMVFKDNSDILYEIKYRNKT